MSYRLGMCGAAAMLFISACGGSSANDGGGGNSGSGATGGSGAAAGAAGSSGTAGLGGGGGTGGGGAGGGGMGGGGTGGSSGADPGTPGLAFETIFMGDTDRNGTPSTTAWRQFGRNIDGLVTTGQSTDVCQQYSGAAPSAKADGDAGIDNSFGANIVPVMSALASDLSKTMTQQIQSGQFTVLMDFGDPFMPSDQTNVMTGLLGGGQLPLPPTWSGADVWPVTHETTINGDKSTPKAKFSAGTIVNGIWTTETAGAFTLVVQIAGFSLAMEMTEVQLSATLSGSGPTLAGSVGTLSGVVNTEKFIAELKKLAGSFDPTLCNSATFESLATQFRQASDILSDGTQDPTKPCDAISIGIGFESKAARIGAVAAAVPPPVDPCSN